MQTPAPNNAGAMAKATTTNYSVQNIGAAIQRRKAAGRQAAPVQETRTDDIAQVAALYGAPVVKTPRVARAAPEREERTYRLSELAEKIRAAKAAKKTVAEARDPDGPDDGGYDPSEIVRTSSSSVSVAASVVSAMQRRR